MVAGDTIPGDIRVVRVTTQGTEIPVLKDLDQDRVDYENNDIDAVNKLYVNTHIGAVSAPGMSESRRSGNAEFFPGETYRVQHKSNADNALSIDHDFDAFDMGIVEKDTNTGEMRTSSLTVNNQELSADVSQSASEFVTFFEFTVPDRTQIALGGSFEAVAIEA